jgi:hypothetical protein
MRRHDDQKQQQRKVGGERDEQRDAQDAVAPLSPSLPGCGIGRWCAQGRGRAGRHGQSCAVVPERGSRAGYALVVVPRRQAR